MKKEDIKHPMILVLREGLRAYVLPHEKSWQAIDEHGGWMSPQKFKNDLTHKYHYVLDIVQVLDQDGKVLWQREEKTYIVGVAETDDNMDLHTVSAEKAERIKRIIEE